MYKPIKRTINWGKDINFIMLFNRKVSHKWRLTPIHRSTVVGEPDPLVDLIQHMSDLYEKPLQMLWNGTQFGILDVKASFFITYSNVNEIILRDKCLNISIL